MLVKWDWTSYFIQALTKCSHVNFEITFFEFCNSKQKLQHQKFSLFIQNNFTSRMIKSWWLGIKKKDLNVLESHGPSVCRRKQQFREKLDFGRGMKNPWQSLVHGGRELFSGEAAFLHRTQQSQPSIPVGFVGTVGSVKTLWQRGVGKAQDSGFCRVITLSWMWREHRGHSQSGKLE